MEGALKSSRGDGLSSCGKEEKHFGKEEKHFGFVVLLKIEDFSTSGILMLTTAVVGRDFSGIGTRLTRSRLRI